MEDLAVSVDENLIVHGIGRFVDGAGVNLIHFDHHRGTSVAFRGGLDSYVREHVGAYVIVHFWKAKHDSILEGEGWGGREERSKVK